MWSKPPLYLPTKLQKIIEITKDKGKKTKINAELFGSY